jgi:tetratricopeptide (TPR) repeat protein
MEHIAWIYNSQGRAEKALDQHMQVFNQKVVLFGEIHSSTLSTVKDIATIYANSGEYRKAIEWLQRAVDGYTRTPDTEGSQSDLLDAIRGMATVYSNMGQVSKGLNLLRDTVERIRQRQTTSNDDGTLETSVLDAMHDLANMCDHVGKDDEALLWYSRTVEGYQRVLGKNHPTTRKEAEKLSELRNRMKQ